MFGVERPLLTHSSARLFHPPAPPTPQIDPARGRALAEEVGALFFETSAKDGTGVKDAFHALAAAAVARMAAAEGGAAAAAAGATGVQQLRPPSQGGKGGSKECALQ